MGLHSNGNSEAYLRNSTGQEQESQSQGGYSVYCMMATLVGPIQSYLHDALCRFLETLCSQDGDSVSGCDRKELVKLNWSCCKVNNMR